MAHYRKCLLIGTLDIVLKLSGSFFGSFHPPNDRVHRKKPVNRTFFLETSLAKYTSSLNTLSIFYIATSYCIVKHSTST